MPALNDLLAPFGVTLGGRVLEGSLALPSIPGGMTFQTGTQVVGAPLGSWLYSLGSAEEGAMRVGGRRGGLEGSVKSAQQSSTAH